MRFLLPLIIFSLSQILAVSALGKYQKYQGDKLIVKLEEYKQNNSTYPTTLNEDMFLCGIDYDYDKRNDEYFLNFKGGYLI